MRIGKAHSRPITQLPKRMLGRNANPYFARQDDYLRETASAVGADNYDTVPLGIYFGEPGVDHPDPYFEETGHSALAVIFAVRA